MKSLYQRRKVYDFRFTRPRHRSAPLLSLGLWRGTLAAGRCVGLSSHPRSEIEVLDLLRGVGVTGTYDTLLLHLFKLGLGFWVHLNSVSFMTVRGFL